VLEGQKRDLRSKSPLLDSLRPARNPNEPNPLNQGPARIGQMASDQSPRDRIRALESYPYSRFEDAVEAYVGSQPVLS